MTREEALRSYTLDAAGNRTGMTDARGITVSYAYDSLNRVTLTREALATARHPRTRPTHR